MHNALETALIATVLSQVPDGNRFRRIDGTPTSRVIYFLPWHTPLKLARAAGLVALDFLACYEMPNAVVSAVPAECVRAVNDVVDDAEALVREAGLTPSSLLMVAFSIGTFPATMLANRWGATLCSVCSADRGAPMIWESNAACKVKNAALSMGYGLSDFEWAFRGYNPVDNLSGIGKRSAFLVSRNDPFVPAARTDALLERLREVRPGMEIHTCTNGHLKAMIASRTLQAEMGRSFLF
ncbi:MAG: hypothetical protein U1E46_14950 [Hyphomicrobiales bacterium]